MDNVPGWLQPGFWGLVAGTALLVGAAAGYLLRVPPRLVAAIMAFGSNWLLSHHGAKHRERSCGLQPSEAAHGGSGLAIAVGALLDGIPESIVIGGLITVAGFLAAFALSKLGT